jgi:GT2 family glycosyltransferase
MAKIGLVTVLYKSDEVLEDFFKSIAHQTYKDYVLYLIDNSVNDVTDNLIAEYLKQYPITAWVHIKNEVNTGVAAGNNTGIHLALKEGCSHILLLNNDIEFRQDFVFSRLLSLSEKLGDSMIVPKIFYYSDRKIWMAGGYMNKWRALGIHYGMGKQDAFEYNQPKYITYAPTCFMLIKREVFEKVGYMDEKYFAYYDDTDFVFRAASAGVKLYYEPTIHIYHKVSSSAGTNSVFYVYYSNKNKIYFIRKNLKGINKYFSILYTLFARVLFYLKYDKTRKKKLTEGLRDGFKMSVE